MGRVPISQTKGYEVGWEEGVALGIAIVLFIWIVKWF